MGVHEAKGRAAWEVWRLTHEVAGVFLASFEALSPAMQAWWAETAVPLIAAAVEGQAWDEAGARAHRAIMDAGLPDGAPFTVGDVQPWFLLPAPTRTAWAGVAHLAVLLRTLSPRTTAVGPA